jgi:hypothetical protein
LGRYLSHMAMFTQSHSDPVDADFRWKHSAPNYTAYMHT